VDVVMAPYPCDEMFVPDHTPPARAADLPEDVRKVVEAEAACEVVQHTLTTGYSHLSAEQALKVCICACALNAYTTRGLGSHMICATLGMSFVQSHCDSVCVVVVHCHVFFCLGVVCS
jgi:hypothetical protein